MLCILGRKWLYCANNIFFNFPIIKKVGFGKSNPQLKVVFHTLNLDTYFLWIGVKTNNFKDEFPIC